MRITNAINALEAQGRRCTTVGGSCVYNHNGLHCIVGHMMPDNATRNAADSAKEGSSITALHEYGFEWAQQFTKDQVTVLRQLQRIHDNKGDVPFKRRIAKMREYIAEPETKALWEPSVAFLHAFAQGDMSVIKNPREGLCCQGHAILENVSSEAYEAMLHQWEHYSGVPAFPMPGGLVAYYTEALYEGKQLEYRRSLAKHLVECYTC